MRNWSSTTIVGARSKNDPRFPGGAAPTISFANHAWAWFLGPLSENWRLRTRRGWRGIGWLVWKYLVPRLRLGTPCSPGSAWREAEPGERSVARQSLATRKSPVRQRYNHWYAVSQDLLQQEGRYERLPQCTQQRVACQPGSKGSSVWASSSGNGKLPKHLTALPGWGYLRSSLTAPLLGSVKRM